MRYDSAKRLRFKLPSDKLGHFTVIINKQDAHLT